MNLLPVQYFQDTLPAMRSFLEEIVGIESPSLDKEAVNRFALRVIREVEELGA